MTDLSQNTLEKLSAIDAQAILDGLDRPEVIAFLPASKPHYSMTYGRSQTIVPPQLNIQLKW